MILIPQLSEDTQQYFVPSEKVNPTPDEYRPDMYDGGLIIRPNYLLFGKDIPLRDLAIKPFFGEDINIHIDLSTLRLTEILVAVKKDEVEEYVTLDISKFSLNGFCPAIHSSHQDRHLNFSSRNLQSKTTSANCLLFNISIAAKFEGNKETLSFNETEITVNDPTYDVSLIGFLLHIEGLDTNRARLLK